MCTHIHIYIYAHIVYKLWISLYYFLSYCTIISIGILRKKSRVLSCILLFLEGNISELTQANRSPSMAFGNVMSWRVCWECCAVTVCHTIRSLPVTEASAVITQGNWGLSHSKPSISKPFYLSTNRFSTFCFLIVLCLEFKKKYC